MALHLKEQGEKEKIIIEEKDKSKSLLYILFALGGFVFSRPDFFGCVSPFACALCASSPFEFSFCVLGGALVGCFSAYSLPPALYYGGACFLVCLLRLLKMRKFKVKGDKILSPVFAFSATILCGFIYYYLTNSDLLLLLSVFLSGILSALLTYAFLEAFEKEFFSSGVWELSLRDKLCLGVLFCVFTLCSANLKAGGISLGRIFSFLILLFVLSYGGLSLGTATGVVIASCLSLSEELRFLFPAIIFACFFSGIFSSFGQIPCAVSFAVFSSVICALKIDEGLPVIIEIVIASCIFIVLPSKLYSLPLSYFKEKGIVKNKRVSTELSSSLSLAAQSVGDVCEIVFEVSKSLDCIINPEINLMFSYLQQSVCSKCERKGYCWNKSFDKTAHEILSIIGIEEERKITLKKTCPKFKALYSHILKGYENYCEALSAKNKLSELRDVLTDQFSAMEDFLLSSAAFIEESRTPDKSQSLSLKNALKDSGIFPGEVLVFDSAGTKTQIEISFFDPKSNIPEKRIRGIIEMVFKRNFEKAILRPEEMTTTLIYREKPSLYAEIGRHQISRLEENVCGDSLIAIKDLHGYCFGIISDGMGTGARAKIDSSMTVNIIEKLLCGSFSFESAIKILSSCLIIKSTDESISTVDGIKINLLNGETEFYKAGAASSFIRRDDQIICVEGASLPLGILRETKLFKRNLSLRAGDIILMVSDGALGEDCSFIIDELLSWSGNNMEELSRHIASLSKLRNQKDYSDDITVMAIKLGMNVT